MSVHGLGEPFPVGHERTEVTAETLIDPLVLHGLAFDIFSAYHRGEGGYYLTPPVEYQTGEEADHLRLQLGYPQRSAGDLSLYVLDEEADTFQKWFQFGHRQTLDGRGYEVTSDQRAVARQVLESLRAELTDQVRQPLREFLAAEWLRRNLETHLATLEEQIGRLRSEQERLREQAVSDMSAEGFKLRVQFVSGWAREGELPLEKAYTLGDTGLEGAIAQAVEEFKKLNGRSDAQLSRASLSLEYGSLRYQVPEEFWHAYLREQSVYHGHEQRAIEQIHKG